MPPLITESTFDHSVIEPKWQARWKAANAFHCDIREAGNKVYVLEMFPYTSGRMHMGHARNYTMGDILARSFRARGKNVLYPMGWDSFGLPAENAAIKQKVHPRDFTENAIKSMTVALNRMGYSYDWSREVATCRPRYMRAQQDLFLRFFENGLVFRDASFVNWCESCQTVLANEQATGGVCWRCENPVTKRRVEQWFFNIRKYADELLDGLDNLPGWPDSVKNIQRSWIGRSRGSEILFAVKGEKEPLKVFTTRPDTLFGCTFVILAPEHPRLETLVSPDQREAVEAFRAKTFQANAVDRSAGDLPKEGVFTGRHAINPANGEAVPIYTANFVLMDYGTGAIMSVPAHDQRDFDFAKEYGLPIRMVIQGPDMAPDTLLTRAYEGPGTMVNSGPFSGTPSEEGKTGVTEFLAAKGLAEGTIQYRLQNWSISRQRYWGCPIPIVYCESCGAVPVPRKDLPVLLPDEVKFGTGGSPLATNPAFYGTKCPECQGPARRDTDTMDTFVDSSWYFLRYTAPDSEEPVRTDLVDPWLPVDYYIGGVEHATLHLMYSRFFVKALRDLGLLHFDEPFQRLYNQGMVNDEFGRKQSKSLGNVVEPIETIDRFGADAVRLYLMFETAYNMPINWTNEGPVHARSYLERVWRIVTNNIEAVKAWPEMDVPPEAVQGEAEQALRRRMHLTIQKVTEDTERLQFNTAIAALMELTNEISRYPAGADRRVLAAAVRVLVRLLAPTAPHVTEELWEKSGSTSLLCTEPWPVFDPEALKEDTIEIAVQVNGKLAGTTRIPVEATEEQAVAAALESPKVQERIAGAPVRKKIYVKGRLVNIVAK